MQKIMIVEDDEFLREELENIYHKAGYEVCCVTDFPETGAVCEAEESVDLHFVKKYERKAAFLFLC